MKPKLIQAVCLQCKNLPNKEDCRRILLKAFLSHGKVSKLFIDADLEFAKVYFENSIEADNAYQALNLKAPLNLRIDPPFPEVFSKVNYTANTPSTRSSSKSSLESTNQNFNIKETKTKKMTNRHNPNRSYNNHYEEESEEVDEASKNIFEDRYGQKIEILEGDNGCIYAPVSVEGKDIKFQYMTNGNNDGKLDFDELLYEEFQAYMLWCARKFIKENQPTSKKISNTTIDSTIETLTSMTFQKNIKLPNDQIEKMQQQQPYSSNSNLESNSTPTLRRPHENFVTKGKSNKPEAAWPNKEQLKEKNSDAPTNVIQNSNSFKRSPALPSNQGSFIPRTLPKIEIPPNTFTEVTVVHVENESVGWVQLAANEAIVEDITQRTILAAPNIIKLNCPKIDMTCIALYKDNWFRASVLSVNPMTVRLADVGIEHRCGSEGVKVISRDLFNIPAQAVRVKLASGAPSQLTEDAKLSVKPVEKLADGTYVVQVQGGMYARECSQQRSNVAASGNTSSKVTKAAAATGKSNSLANVKKEAAAKNRLCSANIIGFEGEFQYSLLLNQKQFVFTLIPQDSESVLVDKMLELELYKESERGAPIVANVGDLVAHLNEDEELVRTVILHKSSNGYKLGLIDYGTCANATEVYRLPQKIAEIVEFACVGTVTPENLNLIKEYKNDINGIVVDNGKVKITLQKHDPIEIVATAWVPEQPQHVVDNEKQEVFFNLPPLLQVNNQDAVKILVLDDSTLYVRSRPIVKLLKDIKEQLTIQESAKEALQLPPKVGQLVLAKHASYEYPLRGSIQSIVDKKANVHFIDIQEFALVDVATLQNVNKKLAEFPPAVIPLELKNFTNKRFSPKETQLIEDLKASGTIFTVSLDSEENADLLLESDDSLSTLLLNLNKPNLNTPNLNKPNLTKPNLNTPDLNKPADCPIPQTGKAFFSKVPTQSMEMGENMTCVLNCDYLEQGVVTLCKTDDSAAAGYARVEEIIQKSLKNNAEANCYKPREDELCLARFEGEWFRGACLEVDGDRFSILFIDFGNSETASCKDLRPIDKEAVEIPAIGMICQINDFPDSPSAETMEKVNGIIVPEQELKVQVIDQQDSSYTIVIPAIANLL